MSKWDRAIEQICEGVKPTMTSKSVSGYIKKEDVLKLIDTGCLISNSNYNKEIKLINELPSADVEPVRHGRWVEVKSWESEKYSVTDMRCNLCGKYASLVLPHKTKCIYKYCPFCGAKMDGEEQDHD